MLKEALLHYNMSHARVELIRHNENITYCVNGKYLLRIHKSKEGFDTKWHYTEYSIFQIKENEMKYLEFLRSKGILVQTPIRNRERKLVTLLSDGTVVTMLSWLPGRILEEGDLSERLCFELGKVIGRIHSVTKRFPPYYFPNYDSKLCQRLIKYFEEYNYKGQLLKSNYISMRNALIHIGQILDNSSNEFLLVHSDLSLSNILVTPRGLAIIDFSLLGYSNGLLDFGSLYCFIDQLEQKEALILGYQQITGSVMKEEMIPNYQALQILLGIAIHFEIWKKEEWFGLKLEQWCENQFTPLWKT